MHQIQLTSVAVYYALHSFLVEASRRQQHVDRKEKNEDEWKMKNDERQLQPVSEWRSQSNGVDHHTNDTHNNVRAASEWVSEWVGFNVGINTL